jgi:PhnB protein
MAVTEMFWGDRMGEVTDPFGHNWSICTHVEDLTPEQIDQRAQEFFAAQANK